MRLHDNLSSGNGYKVRLLLAQLGVPFERIEYDIDRGETRTPEFLEKINPNGRVPVLETDGGELLPESNAILFFFAEGTPFLPEGPFERARVLRWMFFEQYSQSSQNIWAHVPRPADGKRRRAVGVGEGLEAGSTARLTVLSLLTFPSALPSSRGALRIVISLFAGLRWEYATTSRTSLKLSLCGYEESDASIRRSYQVGRILGKLEFSGTGGCHSPTYIF
jgi:Glutathione S-transferase, N-terminal domain